LQGWTMLAESCDECNVPLMEKKKGQIISCVGCKRNFKREVNEDDPSTLMMVPIVKDTVQNSAPPQVNSTTLAPPQVNSTTLTEKPQPQISDIMGEKMLQGWTLLGDTCPICNSPLMKDREGQMFCVKCNTRVMHEKDFNPNLYLTTPREERRELLPPPSSFSSSNLQKGMEQAYQDELVKYMEEHDKKVRERIHGDEEKEEKGVTKKQMLEHPSSKDAPLQPISRPVRTFPPTQGILQRTRNTLFEKLELYQNMLAHLNADNWEPNKMQNLLGLITETANAIAALDKLQ